MKGYKAFNKNLTCLGYQYELDKTHIFEGIPILCESGFHFYTELEDVLKYYLKSDMRVSRLKPMEQLLMLNPIVVKELVQNLN